MRTDGLHSVVDRVAYLPDGVTNPSYSIFPPGSGRESTSPPKQYYHTRFFDYRPLLDQLTIEGNGVVVRSGDPATANLYDDSYVRQIYYPAMQSLVREVTGAYAVLAFDHNVRSANDVRRAEVSAQPPVDAAHGDYTAGSGLHRARQVAEDHGRPDLADRHSAIVNVWRPITSLVLDKPLAMCDPASVAPEDFVDTSIDHYTSDDLENPSHSGHIYSLRHSPNHRWFYISGMRDHELLVFKTHDSSEQAPVRSTAHAAFADPDCPARFVPRESIEVRTAVFY